MTSVVTDTTTTTDTDTNTDTDPPGSESSTTAPVCEPDFAPLPGDAFPRCVPETFDCWTSCPVVDPHACTSACAAADPTPPFELDGEPVDCGRCINRLFGICWHEACPAEAEASRCCTEASGCDPECLMYGPCDDEDLECVRQACGQELAAQSTCLMETGALEACRLENGGPATECFGAG